MGLHCVHVDLERWRYGGKPACGCIDGSLGRNLRFMIGANKTQRELHFCVAHGCLGENNSGVGSVGMRTRPAAEEWGMRQSGRRAGWREDGQSPREGWRHGAWGTADTLLALKGAWGRLRGHAAAGRALLGGCGRWLGFTCTPMGTAGKEGASGTGVSGVFRWKRKASRVGDILGLDGNLDKKISRACPI